MDNREVKMDTRSIEREETRKKGWTDKVGDADEEIGVEKKDVATEHERKREVDRGRKGRQKM